MLKVIKFFTKRSYLFILIACLLFIPQSFGYQAKLNMRMVVTGIGIDKVESGYEVTAQVIMPSPGSESGGASAHVDFISEIGDSISDGIQKIAYKVGKIAGLSHTTFVIAGESMLEDNLATALDYFARDAKVNPSVMLLICDGAAKDMIKQTKNLELDVGVGLQKVFIYKQGTLNGLVIPITEFINSSFNIAKSSTVSGILIAPEGVEELNSGGGQEQGDTSSGSKNTQSGTQTGDQSSSSPGGSSNGSSNSSSGSGGSQGSGSGQGGQGGQAPQSARIKYLNDIYYFKQGKYVNKLTEQKQILGVMLADKYSSNGDLKIENVTGEILTDAVITLRYNNKVTKKSIKFKNGKPVLMFDITIKDMQIIEILNKDQPNLEIYNRQEDAVLDLIKKNVQSTITQNIQQAFDKTKSDNVDIFDIAELAYQTKTDEWKDFYNEYGENYLENCDIKVNVRIKTIN